MQILINGWFWAQPTVGYGQYLHGLLAQLTSIVGAQQIIVARPAASPGGPPLPAGVRELRLHTALDRRPKLAKIVFEQSALPRAAAQLARQAPTVLFVPYFGGPLHSPVPVVTTVGDLIPLVLPAYRGSAAVRLYSALVSAAARRSTQILTFSAFSRSEIVRRLAVPAERVTAIALAAADSYRPAEQAQPVQQFLTAAYGLNGPYVYYVGGLDARKNLLTVLQAWAQLPERLHHIPLVIAGRALGRSSLLFPDLDAAIAQLGIAARVRRCTVPLEHGPLLYQGATAFVFPSSYEGFGLPPLEAMASNTPVICSNAGPLPEVVGDAALCVDPFDVSGWAAAVSRVLDNGALRDELRERGRRRAALFSYQRTAAATYRVLARAIGQESGIA